MKTVYNAENVFSNDYKFIEIKKFKDKTFKYTYNSRNGDSPKMVEMFTPGGWVFIANRYDVEVEHVCYTRSIDQKRQNKDLYFKAFDKYVKIILS